MAAPAGQSELANPTFWVGMAFLLFFIILFFMKVHTKIVSALDARGQRIAKELEEARALREEAQANLARIQRRQREASKEADAILAQAEEDAGIMMREAEAQLEQLAQRRERAAEQKIAQAEQNAVKEVRAAAAAVAVEAARRVIAEQMAGPKGDEAIGQAIGQIEPRVH